MTIYTTWYKYYSPTSKSWILPFSFSVSAVTSFCIWRSFPLVLGKLVSIKNGNEKFTRIIIYTIWYKYSYLYLFLLSSIPLQSFLLNIIFRITIVDFFEPQMFFLPLRNPKHNE